jgi:hypothetical protein
MEFEEALVHELGSISGLEGRVFPFSANEGTNPPFIIYVSSDGEGIQTLSGMDNSIRQLDCHIHVVSQTYEELKGLVKQVIDKLSSFFGRAIGINGPTVKSFSYIEPTEMYNEQFDYHTSSFDIKVRV